jgi:hypothetical protein
MFLNNKTAQNGLNISNLFTDYFSLSYSNVCPLTKDLRVTNTNSVDLCDLSINIQEVFSVLENCNHNCSTGPDGIPEIILKQCRYVLTVPLHFFFSLSLFSGTFPDRWKSSFVQPIFKNGTRSDIVNYKLISIMSAIPKLFELILLPKLNFFFSKHIIPEQFGFRPSTSATLNLVTYYNYLTDAIEKGGQVDEIYIDISKAFDIVNHTVLVRKLELMGVRGNILNWFSSFISFRTQKVRVNGFISKNILVPSVVPQGGQISPLLFFLYMNDVGLVFNFENFSLYAGDTKLYCTINSLKKGLKLQKNSNHFRDWCYSNGLRININKCSSIFFLSKIISHYD